MKLLNKKFFSYDTELVASNLLGKVIEANNKKILISETEAYKGNCDEASHAFGRKTSRNSLMYDTYGFIYVYLIYGIHYCLNFTSDKYKPGAVLIRGGYEIDENFEIGKLYDGPGKLTKFLQIDKTFNGLDIVNNSKLKIYDVGYNFTNIEITGRIGISKAKDKLWRYVGKI